MNESKNIIEAMHALVQCKSLISLALANLEQQAMFEPEPEPEQEPKIENNQANNTLYTL